MKNPNWREEELILAVDFYFSHGRKWINSCSSNSPEIIELSNLLKRLTVFEKTKDRDENFRSPSSVHMKLMNFKGIDNDNTSEGLRNSSSLDRQIWAKYAYDQESLKIRAAEVLSEFLPHDTTPNAAPMTDEHDKAVANKLYEIQNTIKLLEVQLLTAREKAVTLSPVGKSQQIINVIYEMLTELSKWQDGVLSLQKIIAFQGIQGQIGTNGSPPSSPQTEHIFQPHKMGGKIGQHVRSSFKELSEKLLLSSSDITDLLSAEWCKKNLHLGYAFLKRIDPTLPLSKQAYEKGYQRYWMQPVQYNGAKYILCKEWFEPNRVYFDSWISRFDLTQSVNEGTIKSPKTDITSQIPSEIRIAGEVFHVGSWKEALLTVCRYVMALERFDKDILINSEKLKGRKRHYFSSNGNGMTRYAVQLEEGLWVETNLNAKQIVSICHTVLTEFGYEHDSFSFHCHPRGCSPVLEPGSKVFEPTVKFSPKYGSITLTVSLLKQILEGVKEIDAREICIGTGALVELMSPAILKDSNYKHPSYPLHCVISFLKDVGAVIPYLDSKAGKYVIEDYEVMQELINNPKLAHDLMNSKGVEE